MVFLILFPLVFRTVICHSLAFTWLNYHQFQCVHYHARNYEEAINQQYLCILQQIRTCTKDTNNYLHNHMYMNHFCGFIDVRKAVNPDVVWHIQVQPNVIVHFLNFSLFHNYWYCDCEYLMVTRKKVYDKFCGNRLPWLLDSFASSVKIIFITQRFNSMRYWVELLYYGAHRLHYKDLTVFIPFPFSITFYLNNEENAFEIFHIITHDITSTVYLSAVNVCSQLQLVCYDGPGIKSPLLPVIYNQSERTCRSTTFQMVCMITGLDPECPHVPRISYQTKKSSKGDFYSF